MLKLLAKGWARAARSLAKKHLREQLKQQKKLLKLVVPSVRKTVRKKPAIKRPVTSLAPVPGRWTQHYYSGGDAGTPLLSGRLTYRLYVPPMLSGAAARPLVIMLHGCEQNAMDFAAGTRMNALADQFGFVVAYPQQSITRHSRRCWQWYHKESLDGRGEVSLIEGLIDALAGRQEIDRSRIYVAGMSSGAAMAHLLALKRPDLIAAVALHSGPAYGIANSRLSALSLMQTGTRNAVDPVRNLLLRNKTLLEMPTLIIQGDADSLVRPVNARDLTQQAREFNRMKLDTGAAITFRPARGKCDTYRLSDYRKGRKLLIRLCQIENLGHAWSGGDAVFRFNKAIGPDASRMCWEFFKHHRRRVVAV